jgi:hypothetical protein
MMIRRALRLTRKPARNSAMSSCGPFMIGIQLVSGQIGRVTGKGIVANVATIYPWPILFALVSLLLIANTFKSPLTLPRWARRFLL